MPTPELSLTALWQTVGFTPNPAQHDAILHVDGPLYLPAGPGSGKTRVLLWRTLNLIVFHNVPPERIFLSTFTEKAALQLREGLRHLLALVTNQTGHPFDLSKMYVGTVHALCQRLLLDRNLYPHRQRRQAPALLDELGQFFFLYNKRQWAALTSELDFGGEAYPAINALFGVNSESRYAAVTNCLALFNRFSEECLDPVAAQTHVTDQVLLNLLTMYQRYLAALQAGSAPKTDFSLLQQHALTLLTQYPAAGTLFQHVIVDEYQDTNTVQERLFFQLAAGHKNLCVVGDDDQALYRFRGATVENFVEFPARCLAHFKVAPRAIPLVTNYRSRQRIVTFYSDFITRTDWSRVGGGAYRVMDKNIHAHSADVGPAVVASTPGTPEAVTTEIAAIVRRLLDTGKVENANQIAFLFPSLKSTQVERMKGALEAVGLQVYAPRAGRFVEIEESTAMFGLFLRIFGKPARGEYSGDYQAFHNWLDTAYARGDELIRADKHLAQFVRDKQAELQRAKHDYEVLSQVAARHHWDLKAPYNIAIMKRALYSAPGLSEIGQKAIASDYFERVIRKREKEGQPFDLGYILKYATSVDWSVLDLFYRLCGFDHFRAMFDLAERGENEDEGPLYNLGLISQYLERFMSEYGNIITAPLLLNEGFGRMLFSAYLFALFRRGESEYEDANDPFPKGRIPFLTIHQAKGLEFPVVVLGNPRKEDKGPQTVETLVRPLLNRSGEPLERQTGFDIQRMFYVALSRAQNLLILAHFKGQGQKLTEPFKQMLTADFPRLPTLDIAALPTTTLHIDDLPRNYSFSGDYMAYLKCARQYMAFKRYGLVPSRSQTMMFGSLVHRTLDDLHQYLIAQRAQGE